MSSELAAAGDPAVRRKAALFLALANLGWGWSFPAMKLRTGQILHIAPEAGELAVVSLFIVWRFLLASLLYAALTFPHQKGHTRNELLGGLTTGLFFVLGLLAQLIGLRYTLPSVSGFLTCMVVLFLPLAQAFLLRKPPPARTWLAVGVALAGMLVLVLGGPQQDESALKAPFPFFGELMTIGGSMLFTGQVLCLDHYGKDAHPPRLALVQFMVTGLVGTILLTLLPGGRELHQSDAAVAIVTDHTVQWTILSTAVFSTVFAFHLMTAYQPKLSPSTAGVIYCLEPVCASMFSILLGMEKLRESLMLGGVLILVGILIEVRGNSIRPPDGRSP